MLYLHPCIRETTEYLELFLRNQLLGESNELKNRYMHVRWKMQKQDIQGRKQDIQGPKQDIQKKEQHIEVPDGVSNKTAYSDFVRAIRV